MQDTKEIWKPIPNYEGLYEISDLGNVKSLKKSKHKIKKPYLQNRYLHCCLIGKNKKLSKFQVHRLVMLAFVGDSNLTVDHINGITTDNSLFNLEYVSGEENTKRRDEKRRIKNGKIGVYISCNKYICANISLGKKNLYLGTYPSVELAQLHYDYAKKLIGFGFPFESIVTVRTCIRK